MKKILLSAGLIFSFGLYAVFNQPAPGDSSVSAPIALNNTQPAQDSFTSQTSALPPPQTVTPSPTPSPAPAPTPKPKGQYTDGSYTGTPADAYYGTVQVRATVSGGKLTGVQFLSYPSDRGTSRQINSIAMPYLTQEAIQAQSANVATVSGASDTSAAFRQSLGDALAQAKA